MSKSILVVDDEKEICSMLRFEFEMEGFEFYEAHCVAAAIEILKSKKIDILLSDVRMPGKSGFDLLKELRLASKHEPRIILMTGFAECTLEEVLAAGAEDLISKPLNLPKLVAQIGKP